MLSGAGASTTGSVHCSAAAKNPNPIIYHTVLKIGLFDEHHLSGPPPAAPPHHPTAASPHREADPPHSIAVEEQWPSRERSLSTSSHRALGTCCLRRHSAARWKCTADCLMCHTSVTPTKAWGTTFATRRHRSAREYIPLRLFVTAGVQCTCAGGPKSVFRLHRPRSSSWGQREKKKTRCPRRVPIARA
jgi:hypothetical protein